MESSQVEEFCYLGSRISKVDIKSQIAQERKSFKKHRNLLTLGMTS